MGDLDMKILEGYYLELEKISELMPHVLFPNIETVSKDEHFWLRVEYFSQTALIEDSIVEMFGGKKDEVTEYLIARIANTSNVILKAKYSNFIFILTKNNNNCQEAIGYYQQALIIAFQETDKEYYELRVDEIFEKILELSCRIKYRLPELKKQIAGYLLDNSIADRLKTRLFLSVRERNIFTAKESEGFPTFFIELAQSTSDTTWVEHNLNIALLFALKFQNQQQLQTIYELLGDNEMKGVLPDNENNLAIPHLNETIYEKAIEYYKKAKCDTKCQYVWRLHTKNKKNKRYVKIKQKVPVSKDVIEFINNRIDTIAKLSSFNVVVNLVTCKFFLFQSNADIKKRSACSQNSIYNCFTPVQVDKNENHKKSDATENNKFFYYHIMMEQNLNMIIGKSIMQCIEKRKLTYKKLHKILLTNSSLGIDHQIDHDEFSIRYTWLSMIDIGLESFFEQCNKIRKGIRPDWRICIDILAIKFEGILREILECNGANLTILKNGDTKTMTLEDMIRLSNESIRDAFYLSFDDDDLNLFQYAFSSKAQCLNIRNNVAHAFYFPQEYTEKNAIIVFLAILRLAKFVPRNDKIILNESNSN